ncbi:MAG: response regulator transcription factor [Phycisphaerae bacterium]|nr:response regulator transcription factor [Phycisphaerae bacterium]
MKVLVVEDDRKIKIETIDDCLESLGHVSDWATNQQEANGLLVANEYDLILLDLQIPSRPGGKDSPEFGKNLLRQIHARKGQGIVPVIIMTAYHQQCVDMLTDLQEIGVNGSISKPFPTSGRTLAVVIEEVMAKHRWFRQANKAKDQTELLTTFDGGVLAYHPRRIELCGETIAEKSRRGYAWQILHVLRETNDKGKYIHRGSRHLAPKLDPEPMQNTLIRSICSLRSRIRKLMRNRLGQDCGQEDIIGNDDHGYHLRDWLITEVYDEAGTLVGGGNGAGKSAHAKQGGEPAQQFSEKQRWVLAQLASEVKLTRRDVEMEFGISERTAKRVLGELSRAGMIEFDRSESPGFYRLR